MSNFTRQDTFDRVALHLLTQGQRSAIEETYREGIYTGTIQHVMYRSPDGLRCAIGVLIPDSEYRDAFEGVPLEGVPLEDVVAECPSLQKHDLILMQELQCIHDVDDVDDWPAELCKTASTFDLDPHVVEDFLE